jgi:O-antigen/teichoic acid export membrane protein
LPTATAWTAVLRLALLTLQFLASVALARLLAPADFGLVTMVAAFTGFAVVLGDLGVSTAVVQRPELRDEHLRAALGLTLVTGGALAAVFVASAPLVAAFYGRPLAWLVRVSGVAFALAVAGSVPRALLSRNLRLGRLALQEVLATAAGSALSVVLAWRGAGAWALVAGSVMTQAAGTALAFHAAGWRPRPSVDPVALIPLLAVGFPLTGFNILNYWARNLDNVLIGLLAGEQELGIYSRAYALMLIPVWQMSGMLSAVLVPALARLQHDAPRARRMFLRAEALSALIAFPALAGLAVTADTFVRVVYGPRWMPMVPTLRVLLAVGMLQCVMVPLGCIYTSHGRTRRLLGWGIGASVVIMAAIAIGA